MAELIKVNAPVRKPLFEGVQGENESRSIQFDITPWVEELGDGAVTATAKRSQDSQPYPVTVTKDGNTVTWKPTSTDTAFAGVGSFQLEYTVDDVLAKTCIWSTMVAPSLDPAGDPPDPYDNWLAEMRQIAADALQDAQDADASAQDAEAWAKGTKNGTPVPSTADQYENNSKYWAEQSLANQYGAYIVKSASGDIASFNDGADDVPMKSLNVTITPKQSGSGDPSPDNIRAISGTITANVFVTGTNIWDEDWEPYGSSQIKSKTIIPCKENTQYYIKCPIVGVSLYFKGANNENLGSFNGNNEAFTTPSGCVGFWLYAESGYGTTYNNDISINYPSTDHEYHPYAGRNTPVPLGQTVYGGELDVTSGVLTVNTAFETYDGSSDEEWSDNGVNGVYLYLGSNTHKEVVAANIYKAVLKSGTLADYTCKINTAGTSLLVKNPNALSAADFKTALASQNLQIVYELTTPTTVQLTPTQVATLLGTNNVWADCGAVEVEYRADPTLAYAEISPSVASVIAPVEETNIATRNYTTGSLLIMNNMLYKVTANIANGGTITPNTNVTATTLSEVISAL